MTNINITEKSRMIALSAATSAFICSISLCLMLSGGIFYTNDESHSVNNTISTNAEISNTQFLSASITFDDSIWGRLARAIEKGLSSWQD